MTHLRMGHSIFIPTKFDGISLTLMDILTIQASII